MFYSIGADKRIFRFSGLNKPAAYAASGDTLEFMTMDCFSNQIESPEVKLEVLDWNVMNPATGPVFVKDALPGDILKVDILSIEVSGKSVVAAGKAMGVFGGRLSDSYIKILKNADGKVLFSDKVILDACPMIGVIGVAPRTGEEVNCGVPGPHGGNMDNTMTGEGASVYFPVFQKGALLALGDVHAVMGDGEVCVCGAETSAKVTLRAEVIKGFKISGPVFTNRDCVSTVASSKTLDRAAELCTLTMADLIARGTKLKDDEIAMLMSLAGNLEICQVVDPKKTARFVMPKKVLDSVGFDYLQNGRANLIS